MARIQPFCTANNNNSGYFDGIKIFTRMVTDELSFYVYTLIAFVYYGSHSGTFQFEEDFCSKDARGITEIYMK